MLVIGLLATGCASEPLDTDPEINWIELLDAGGPPVVREGSFEAEAFTGEALRFRQIPTALELLEAYRYKNAHRLAGPTGQWPTIPLPTGHALPDPRYPIRTLLGWSYEPSYVIVREANALIMRTSKGSRVVPLDPDKPIGWPDDGSRRQRRERNAFLRSFDRDHEALEVDPKIAP